MVVQEVAAMPCIARGTNFAHDAHDDTYSIYVWIDGAVRCRVVWWRSKNGGVVVKTKLACGAINNARIGMGQDESKLVDNVIVHLESSLVVESIVQIDIINIFSSFSTRTTTC